MANFFDTAAEIDKQRKDGVPNLCAVMDKAASGIEVQVIGVDPKGKIEMTVDTKLSADKMMEAAKPVTDAINYKYNDVMQGKPAVVCMPAPAATR